MQDVVVPGPVDAEAELDRIAARYRRAGGPGMKLLNLLGGQAEGLIDRLPAPVRGGLTGATERALHVAVGVAQKSRGNVPDQPRWVNTALGTAMGAAGGFGGLPSALVELPATTTLLLRAIQGVAAQHGFDPAEPGVQFECVRVFAAAGPLEHDNATDLGFLSLRLTLTGGAMQGLIARVAPRLATVLGQKLATQTVPVLGAMAGATTNFMFTSYYQDMAHVHFALRRLAVESAIPHEQLVGQLAGRMRVARG